MHDCCQNRDVIVIVCREKLLHLFPLPSLTRLCYFAEQDHVLRSQSDASVCMLCPSRSRMALSLWYFPTPKQHGKQKAKRPMTARGNQALMRGAASCIWPLVQGIGYEVKQRMSEGNGMAYYYLDCCCHSFKSLCHRHQTYWVHARLSHPQPFLPQHGSNHVAAGPLGLGILCA